MRLAKVFGIIAPLLLLSIHSEAADHYKFSPYTGKPDNTGPFLAGTLSDGKTCTYTSATGMIDCNTSGGAASAAGGLGAVQYNSPVGTLAGDETKVSINPNGNVGIGTTNGLALFSVNSSAAQDLFRIDDSAGSDSTPFIIDQTGNVGIGSANPSAILAISSTLAQTLFRVDDNGSGDLDPFIIDQNGNVGIGTSNTERDRLLIMGGNVGIGTWVPSTTLDVAGTIVTTSGGNLITGGNIGIGTNILGNAGLAVMGGNVGVGTWIPAGIFDVRRQLTVINGGNVGINSVSPGVSFDVGGSFRTVNSSSSGTFNQFVNNGLTTGTIALISSTNSSSSLTGLALDVQLTGANNIGTVFRASQLGTSGYSAIFQDQAADPSPIVFDATGNIGFGTLTANNQKLTIVGNVGIATVKDGDLYVTTTPPNGGMIIEGNVGIGTVTPGVGLDVALTGGIRLPGTGAGSFRIQAAANQACTTTCTTGKALCGLDQGTLGAVLPSLVGPADATADQCLCGS